MGTEHGQKGAILQPPCIQLPVSKVMNSGLIISSPEPFHGRILIAAAAPVPPFPVHGEESADIQGPVGVAAHGHIQPLPDLDGKALPGGRGVPGPEHGPVFLDGGIAGTGQVQNALTAVSLPLVLIDALGVKQGIAVGPGRIQVFLMLLSHQKIALPGLPLLLPAPVRAGEGLRGIAPPGVKALIVEPLPGLPEIELPGLRVKGIVGGKIQEHMSFFIQLFIILSSLVHIWPDRNHGMGMHFMNLRCSLLHIGITPFVQKLLSPVSLLPALPVLDNPVYGNAPPAVLGHCVHQLLLA